jgi:hypothetical protein
MDQFECIEKAVKDAKYLLNRRGGMEEDVPVVKRRNPVRGTAV